MCLIGKDYAETRVKKRERRQPQTIPDLPYLHWEKTGQPPAGPYAVSHPPPLTHSHYDFYGDHDDDLISKHFDAQGSLANFLFTFTRDKLFSKLFPHTR